MAGSNPWPRNKRHLGNNLQLSNKHPLDNRYPVINNLGSLLPFRRQERCHMQPLALNISS